ncbi:hypothetical protein ACFLUG_01340 [Chloroflexota bacterium]
MIGWVVIGLITVPLVAMLAASVLIPPRSPRAALHFTTAMVLQVVAMLIAFIIFGWLLGFIVP